MYFAIQSVFISTYAIISSPSFPCSDILPQKTLKSLLSDTHSLNLATSIIARELYIDTLMVYGRQICLILFPAPLQSHS